MAGFPRFSVLRQLRVVLQVLSFLFVAGCVLYTTNLLFIAPLSSLLLDFLEILVSRPSPVSNSGVVLHGLETGVAQPVIPPLTSNTTQARRQSMFSWTSSEFTLRNGLGHLQPIYVDESKVLSKAMSTSMHPSKVTPFFYRAKGSPAAADITITTLITSNRFDVFARLVEKYRGSLFGSAWLDCCVNPPRPNFCHRTHQGRR